MEEVMVFGYGPYKLTSDNGEFLEGYSFHLGFFSPSTRVRFVGSEVKSISVPKNVYDTWQAVGKYIPKPYERCIAIFNYKGKITEFRPVEKK